MNVQQILERVVSAAPRVKTYLSLHDVSSPDAVAIVKSLPKAKIRTSTIGSSDMITLIQDETRIMLFLSETARSYHKPLVEPTPVADRILKEAGR